MGEAREVEIARVGSRGDGVALTQQGPVFIPQGLPGERWRISGEGGLERLSDMSERRAPLCRHFGTCGGCAAQHMSQEFYHDWKRGLVIEAFAHRGLVTTVEALQSVDLHSRRRATFGFLLTRQEAELGFRQAGKHALVDLDECPVLDRAIVKALPVLRDIASAAGEPGRTGRMIVTKFDRCLDVACDTGRNKPDADPHCELARRAAGSGIASLSVDGEPIFRQADSVLTISGVEFAPSENVFLQAVPQAEALMLERIFAAIGNAKRVADLFCGIGTFSLPLARRVRVTALDFDKRAIIALEEAQRRHQGLKPVEVRQRDLFRHPLSERELRNFDAVIFDPPRAGAAAQAARIAKSNVPTVVAVSCNPATLARDARILTDGGYDIRSVTPIDQFVFSPHVEVVAVFGRAPQPASRRST